MWTSFWETNRFQYQPWSPWSILVFSLMPELISYADEREYLNWSSSHKICDYKIRSPEWKVTESVRINARRIWALCLGKSKRTKESERNNAMLSSLKFEDQCTDRPRGVCQERGQGAGTEGARLPFFRNLRCHPQLRIKGSAAPSEYQYYFQTSSPQNLLHLTVRGGDGVDVQTHWSEVVWFRFRWEGGCFGLFKAITPTNWSCEVLWKSAPVVSALMPR